ncbi:MAG: hypothetical protein HY438_00290 [DPANN group archaeon]|nr:hypothetical protein [DPANN group archaeon]
MARRTKNHSGWSEALLMLALILFTAAAFAYASQYDQPSRSMATGKVVVQVVAPENQTQENTEVTIPVSGLIAGTRGPRWQ